MSKVLAKYCLRFVDQTLFVRYWLLLYIWLFLNVLRVEGVFIENNTDQSSTSLLKRKLLQLIDLILSHMNGKSFDAR